MGGGHRTKLQNKILDLVLHIDPSSVQQYRHQTSIYVSHCFYKTRQVLQRPSLLVRFRKRTKNNIEVFKKTYKRKKRRQKQEIYIGLGKVLFSDPRLILLV